MKQWLWLNYHLHDSRPAWNDLVIIDSHVHVLPDEFRNDKDRFLDADLTFRELFASPKAKTVSVELLLKEMKDSGVDRSVIAGYGWTDFSTAQISNDYLLESANASNGTLIPLCSVSPLWGTQAIDEVERCTELGAKGIGELHPDSQNFLDTDFGTLAPLLETAKKLRLPILMHTSEPVGHSYPGKGTVTPEYSLALAQAFPEVVFVFAHFGGGLPFYSLMPEVHNELRNVYFDSAASPLLYRSEVFEASVAAAGPDKILFASDFPLITQDRALRDFRQANLSNEQIRSSLDQNARRVWSII